MSPLPSRTKARKFFQDFGLKFGIPPEKLDLRLSKLMGAERFSNHLSSLEEARMGRGSMTPVYEVVRSMEEANLLMSHQVDLLVEIALWIEQQIRGVVHPGNTIVDLGCWNGALTHWLANLFPDCSVVGIDAIPTVIDLASNAQPRRENLRFICWDYSALEGRPELAADILISSVGIDFRTREEHWGLDVSDLRDSFGYRSALDEMRPYLESWRSISSAGAWLFPVLRLPYPDSVLALADAAQTVGWTLDLDRSSKVDGGREGKLPALSLTAKHQAERLAEDDVVSWYAFTGAAEGSDERLEGAKAIAFYRSIGPREVLAKGSMKYDDGHVAVAELGRAGSLGYLLVRATNGGTELQLAGTGDIERLQPSPEWGFSIGARPEERLG